MANRHLIGKQVLKIEIDASKNAYAIQQKMSEFVWKELRPKLASLFDSIVDEDEVIRFDTIEIDIGRIDLNVMDIAEIANRIIELLSEELRKGLRRYSPEKDNNELLNNKGSEKKIGFQNNLLNRKTKKNDQEKEEYQKDSTTNPIGNFKYRPSSLKKTQPLRRYYFESWLYWLEKGTLSSYAIVPQEDWMLLVLETLGLDLNAVTVLENKLRKHPIAFQRLILQHSEEDLKSVVELYTGYAQIKVLTLLNELRLLSVKLSDEVKESFSLRNLEIMFWEQVFEIVILKKQKLDSIRLGREIINQLIISNTTEGQQLRKLIQQKAFKKPKNQYYILKEISDYKDFLISDYEQIIYRKIDKNNTKPKTEESEEKKLPVDKELLESPQFFANAGMVLLHPFLNRFFDKLELLKDKDFKDHEARSKAVNMLHFLATGDEEPKEYEMVLPKFLCEMPINVPIDHTIEISEEEKEEASKLLLAAISHWGVLGTTSPEGLQEGFLKREGKLEKEQAGWKLFVEQKTLDILLDRLPWSINIIKLPWMNEILKVEWR